MRVAAKSPGVSARARAAAMIASKVLAANMAPPGAAACDGGHADDGFFAPVRGGPRAGYEPPRSAQVQPPLVSTRGLGQRTRIPKLVQVERRVGADTFEQFRLAGLKRNQPA